MPSPQKEHRSAVVGRALRAIVRLTCCVVAACTFAWAATAIRAQTPVATTRPAEAATGDKKALAHARPSFESYDVVVRRNIFSISGPASTTATTPGATASSTSTQPAPRTGSAAWVLTGIVTSGDLCVAFVENTSTGATIRVRAGDTVASMRMVRIESQKLELEAGGSTRSVAIGFSLDGSEPPTSIGTTASTNPSTSPEGNANAASDDRPAPSASELSTIEKLKARRAKELAK